jgi:transposase
MGSSRRKFTPEFRVEVARLVIDTGRPIAQVAREIGVGEALLGRWVHQERARCGPPDPDDLDLDERAELKRLGKENAELRIDNGFLGKAAAFFASKPANRRGSS